MLAIFLSDSAFLFFIFLNAFHIYILNIQQKIFFFPEKKEEEKGNEAKVLDLIQLARSLSLALLSSHLISSHDNTTAAIPLHFAHILHINANKVNKRKSREEKNNSGDLTFFSNMYICISVHKSFSFFFIFPLLLLFFRQQKSQVKNRSPSFSRVISYVYLFVFQFHGKKFPKIKWPLFILLLVFVQFTDLQTHTHTHEQALYASKSFILESAYFN